MVSSAVRIGMEGKVFVFLLLLVCLQICDFKGISENTTAWVQGDTVQILNDTVACLKGQSCVSPQGISFGQGMRPFSLSFHTAWNYLLFSDSGLNTIVVYPLNATIAVYAHVGTSPFVGHVAVDWLRNNIYWADAGFGWIGLQSLKSNPTKFGTNSQLRVIVHTQLEHPYGVVVAAQYRRVFWSDLGPSPKIESSDLLGHSRQAVVWQGLVSPTALSVDQSTQRLFWVDQSKHTIESCDFNGANRRLLYYSEESNFGGVLVFADYVLFTETNTRSLQGVDKNTGKQAVSQVSLASDSNKPGNLAVFSTALQPRGNNVSCDQLGCGHICMQQEQDSFCICSSGSTLNADGKTCQGSSTPLWKSFIVSTLTRVCALPINLLFSFPYLPPTQTFYGIKCFLNESNIQHLAINSYNATLYYVTGTSSIRAYDLPSGHKFVLMNVSDVIGGIAYDEARGTIMWSETSGGRIMALDLHSASSPIELYSSLSSPGDMAVSALQGQLFWVENGKQQVTIVTGPVVSPFNKTELVNTDLIRPWNLAYDSKKNRLYWLDVDKVGSVKSDGSDKSVFTLNSVVGYRGLAVFRSYLVWLTNSPANLTFRTSDLRDANRLTSFTLPSLTELTDVVFYDADAEMPDTGSCGRNNGGCDHICIVDGETPRCVCKFGFQLQADGVTCAPRLVTSNFFLAIDTVQSTIFQIATNGSVSGISVSVGSQPDVAIYSQLTSDVIWFDSTASVIKRSSLVGGFAEQVITPISRLNKVTSMSIDYSAANLYFAESKADETFGWVKVISLKRPGALNTLISNVTIRFLATAPERGRMAYGSMSGSIYLSDMAGQEGAQLLSTGLTGLSGLTFTNSGGSVVWSDWKKDEVTELNLSTQSSVSRLKGAGSLPYSLVAGGSNLFYLSKKTRGINNLTSGNQESTLYEFPELTGLTSLAFQSSIPTNVVTACSDRNGRCSTLCIPARDGSRKCACADGVQLRDDKRTCSDVEQCSETIKNGYLASTCDRFPGEECSYSCAEGYLKSKDFPSIACDGTGQWNVSTDTLCQRACSNQIQNGDLDTSCHPTSGVSCSVTCRPGYLGANGMNPVVTCGGNGQWTPNADSICVSKPSPEPFPGYAIGIIAAAGVAVVAVVVGCILYRRMRRYGGHHPKRSISEYIKSNVAKRKNSTDSAVTARYAPYPSGRAPDAESVYDEIQEYGQSNGDFVDNSVYLDPSFHSSGYITPIRGSVAEDGYLTATGVQLSVVGVPQLCEPRQAPNGGYLTPQPAGIVNPTYHPLPDYE